MFTAYVFPEHCIDEGALAGSSRPNKDEEHLSYFPLSFNHFIIYIIKDIIVNLYTIQSLPWDEKLQPFVRTLKALRSILLDSISLIQYGLGVLPIATHLIIELSDHSIHALAVTEYPLVVILILTNGLLLSCFKHEGLQSRLEGGCSPWSFLVVVVPPELKLHTLSVKVLRVLLHD